MGTKSASLFHNVTNLSTVDLDSKFVFDTRNAVVCTVGSVLNVLTLVAVVTHKDLTKYLRCTLISLVITDLSMAMLLGGGFTGKQTKFVLVFFSHMAFVILDCTALTLFAIAVDRTIAVFFPSQYKYTNKKYVNVKIALSVLCPWMLATCFSVISFKKDAEGLAPYPLGLMTEGGLLLQGVVLLLCGLGVLLAYLAVGLRLSLQARHFVVHPAFLSGGAIGNVTPAERVKTRRLTVHMAFLAVWFCIIYIPFSSYLLMLFITRVNPFHEYVSTRQILMSFLPILNSVCNPFIFFWRFVTFRSFVDTLRGLFRRTCTRGTARESPAQPAGDVEMARLPTVQTIQVT